MNCDLVLGGQWGDEGKGKIVDYLAAGVHAVVRCQGGANAGHTLVFGAQRLALHQIPSGVRHPECLVVLGNGMVVDPLALIEELDALAAAGIDLTGRVRVSQAAHMVLPCHRIQDRVEEHRRGSGAVGTTGRGIGPAYADKAARRGVQLEIFLRPDAEARAELRRILEEKRTWLAPDETFDVETVLEEVLACRQRIAPLLTDTTALLHEMLAEGRRILLEGAQGAMLDLDHGSYPFVTSSACTSAGALIGSGLPPQALERVVGVVKAYATRVGNGPFPTELTDSTGEKLRKIGHEFGATTGRPRRCGWFDATAVRYAARINGFTELALTKLDVLDTFDTIRIGIGLELDGQRTEHFPAEARALARCKPVYREVPGWGRSTSDCRSAADLPAAARRYVALIEECTGVRVGLVSVGPERDRTFRIESSGGA